MTSTRNIINRNKSFINLGINFKEVKYFFKNQIMRGMIYSTISSICSFIITSLLSLLIYENVVLKEASQNSRNLIKLKKKNFNFDEEYQF